MTNLIRLVLLGGCLFAIGCQKSKVVAPAVTDESRLSLKGTQVRVALNRSALGLSTERPFSRQTGTYNGVEVSISGYVVEDNEKYLILSNLPDPHEHARGLTWIPHTSVLSIYQASPEPKVQTNPFPNTDISEPWRLEAIHNLLGMVSFPLRDLPQGKLTIWWTKDGKKEFLDEIDTTPGFDRWLCVGVEPVNNDSLFMSVVSEEDKGSNMIGLPSRDLTPLHHSIKPDHDWRKPSIIAAEGSGDGKLWAQLKPSP